MSAVMPSFMGFNSHNIPQPQVYLLDLMSSLGYNVNVASSVHKMKDSQTYCGVINVVDTDVDYNLAWDDSELISASSGLYDTSDVLQGTVQSLLIDTGYTSGWKIWRNQKSTSYDSGNSSQSTRPPFTIAGALQTYDGTHACIPFNGVNSYFLGNGYQPVFLPQTLIGVAKDWTGGAFQSSAQYGVQVSKNTSTHKLALDDTLAWNLNNSAGTFTDTGLIFWAICMNPNGYDDSKDLRFWLNDVEDSTQDCGFGFGGYISARIGCNVNGTSRMNGKILTWIMLKQVVSSTDMTSIFNNINSKFAII